MDKDDHKEKSTFHHHHQSGGVNQMHGLHINDATSKENLANILHNLSTIRRVQESSLKSVSEESFSSSSSMSCAEEKTFKATATMASSSQKDTTGGNEMLTDEDNKASSSVSGPLMMEPGACPIGRAMFAKQQGSIASSSTSSIASTSVETARKTKTLSFLHNEDLFATGTTISGGNSSSNSLHNDDKLLPTASHLFRSISFQEQRRQYQKSTSVQRTESGKESSDSSGARKMAILSPKHSLQELNDRIKQHQMRLQQQMFYGSSELSM